MFKDSFDDYINSDNEELRKAGIELLAHFPNDFLLKNKQDIVGFCFSEYKEVRKAIQPTIERLVKLDSKFKQSLLDKLLLVLTEAESYEGLHENSYQLLTTYFKDRINRLSEEQIFQLVLDKLGLSAEEILFIDDSPHKISNAKKIGIEGICFENNEQLFKAFTN